MKVYGTKEIRNVGIVGHGHAGKTSLVAAMLFDAALFSPDGPAPVFPLLVVLVLAGASRVFGWFIGLRSAIDPSRCSSHSASTHGRHARSASDRGRCRKPCFGRLHAAKC